MRKFFFLLFLALSITPAWAAVVDAPAAQQVAQQFIQRQYAGRMMGAAPQFLLAHTEFNTKGNHVPVYYVFNSSAGFVIVSGENRSRGILAYGDQPIRDLASLAPSMRYWLDCYKRQIEFLQDNPAIQVSVPSLNAPSRAGQSVNPLITANWSQIAPYWNECPVYGTDTCYTGCPATSLSMVFHYWRYPQQQTPAVPSYTTSQYGDILPELPPTVFDWDNMLNDYAAGNYNPEQATAVAHLMRYIGQVEEMDYTISGSGAYLNDILRAVQFFEYDQNARMLFKSDDLGQENYSDAQWANLIQTELRAGRPIVYCAYDNYTGAGHAFNVDGYDANADTYHVNWGWNGRGNGFFALNAFGYDQYTFGTAQQMIVGIQPPADYLNPRLQAYPLAVDMQCYINRTATATISLKGTNLTQAVTLSLNDASGVFSIDATRLTADEANAGRDITVSFAPVAVGDYQATLTCSSEETDPVTVVINAVAPLEVYPLVMQPADENFINLTSFRANWIDETPAANVASYTLEVSSKPAFTLLEEADFSDLPRMSPTNQASHATDYLPDGWSFTGSEFNLEGGCVMPRRNSVITTDELNLKGYGKVTVQVLGRSYGSWGDPSELTISTGMASEVIAFPFSYTTMTVVLDCAETDRISFNCGYYPMIQNIKIYAGDATQGAMLMASETGDDTYRLIDGITTGKGYTVNDLKAGGTFLYKVKALYIDGTESEWSNVEMVTLFENSHNYELGDVNHDRQVNVSDVTTLIAYILGNIDDICTSCGDIDGDGVHNVSDVTALIRIVLNH